MRQASLTRRLVAGATGLMIGAAGALALAAPAQATDEDDGAEATTFGWSKEAQLTGEPVCKEEAGETTVTWTVTNTSPWVPATITALSAEVEGFEVDDVIDEGESLVGSQTFEAGVTEATLTVELKWAWEIGKDKWKESFDDATVTLELAKCGEEEEDEAPSGFASAEFDCDTFSLVLTNNDAEALTVFVVPSEGDTAEVTIEAGETTEPIEFASSEGLTVDVQVDEGESALEEGPFEISSEKWAELGCEEDDGQGGEDSGDDEELPVTGMGTGLIAGGAVALLALGAGLFLIARRRRVTFTA